MKLWRYKVQSGNTRFRLVLTLGFAVVLPALMLILVNLHHVETIQRDKKVEAFIHRDFQYILSTVAKNVTQKANTLTEEARDAFPEDSETETAKRTALSGILAKSPWLAHVFVYDCDKGLIIESQPKYVNEPVFREDQERIVKMYNGWFSMEGREMGDIIRGKTHQIMWYGSPTKRVGGTGTVYGASAFFVFPKLPMERPVFGGVVFDPIYLKESYFPQALEEAINLKVTGESRPLAMEVVFNDKDIEKDPPLAASAGWGTGKPEVTQKLDEAFLGLGLGIKFQGTTAEAIGRRWVIQSLLILGVLSVLIIGGLVLTYRSVNKQVALARLKADFVSNVSHELRTPLALIRLYAETLELGRITTQEKKDEYYSIIRKESERLTALINNILDFSRIEAGRKEYDFRETDIAELVRSTLDAYRYQIEQQGFVFEESIEQSLPAMRVDREAIARALVNLINNALKYSNKEKFLGVKLYQANSVLKLEVTDRGIGIDRREQTRIFEKFYRTCDPLVHDTKGSGLGLSLVQHITHAHGGEVEVESTPGRGSKFTLSLPVTVALPSTATA